MSDTLEIRDCICLRTRRSARLLTQFYDEHLRPCGLRVTQFTLLAAIAEMTPAAQQPLAKFMGMDRTTLTRNLALLERDGFVTVGSSPTDQRQRAIRLTHAGEEAIRRARPSWERAQREALAAFTDKAAGGGSEPALRWLEHLGDPAG